jgi:CheY-like chemotaxis protein
MDDAIIWQVLYVDDDEEACLQVKDLLEGEVIADSGGSLHLETLSTFSQALQTLEERRFDLVILDIRIQDSGDDAGITILESVQQRRFIPVVFYTGLPHLVRDLENSLIRVVERSTGVPGIRSAIEQIFATKLPQVNRALISYMELVQRDYMWQFVATHWEEVNNTSDRMALVYLLARRLAMSLSGSAIHQLAQILGEPVDTLVAQDKIHPMRYYITPPVDPVPLAGDLYLGQISSETGYWILLTPSCDLAWNKADQVLLARCLPLTELDEFQRWQSRLTQPSNNTHKNLTALLLNNREKQADRFFFLPGALHLIDLVADFQQLVSLPCGSLEELKRLASLDSPFAEALLSRFARYYGRLGTPDLDVDVIFARLRSMGEQ